MNMVDHPTHYNGCGVECIDTMEPIFGEKNMVIFCLLNAYKYIWRYPMKGGIEDLEKAQWYIERAESLGAPDYGRDYYNFVKNLLDKARINYEEGNANGS